MGGCQSAKFVVDSSMPGQDEIASEVFQKLHLTSSDLNLLYDIFLKINKTSSPYVYRSEITSFFRMEEGELTNRIFDLFAKKSGRLDFNQFVCTMWNFLSLEADELSTFAFVLFDVDQSGSLTYDEVVKLIETIHRKKYSENIAVQTMCDEIRKMSRTISFKQFKTFAKLHPGLCGPLASVQFMMKKRMIGDAFWTKLQIRRAGHAEQSKTGYVKDLLQFVKNKYDSEERDRKLKKIQGATQQKIEEIFDKRDKKQAMERQRNDAMLDYFQLNPHQSKNKKKSSSSSSSIANKLQKRSPSKNFPRKSRVVAMKEESDGEEEEEEEEGEEGDKENDENNNNNNVQTEDPTSPTQDTPAAAPPPLNQPTAPPAPEFISSSTLRRTLIVTKQNSNDSTKKLFHPNSIPRRTFVEGITKIVPAVEPPKITPIEITPAASGPSSPEGQSLTSPVSPNESNSSSNSAKLARRETTRKQSSFQSNAPLPAISSTNSTSRKTIVEPANNQLNKLPSTERRSTKLQPIVR